ncbi:MAG: sensor histidine kinase [Lachnospiraceae bacterium]|nr:sensor histidine kinase [Lachnospiraceae bacterium]
MNLFIHAVYYFSFTVELLLASLLFARFFERKKYGLLFIGAGLVAMGLVSVLWNPVFNWAGIVQLSFKYVVFFLLMTIMLGLSFDCGPQGALYCSTLGYCIQHIVYNTYCLMRKLLQIPFAFSPDVEMLPDNLLHVLWFVICYTVMYIVSSRKYGRQQEMMKSRFMKNGKVIAFAALFLLVATFLDNISYGFLTDWGVEDGFFLINLYLTLVTICIAYILLSILKEERAQEELESMKLLLHNQRKVYRNNKELIDSINLKAHDLKHQIHALGGSIPKREAKEMEELVNQYDSFLRTGSEALDIVLAEKGAHCLNSGITLTCLLDGTHISGFSDTDIYSFFGNALDNAMDAVEKLPPEKRIISLTEQQQGSFINIRLENYCGETVEMGDNGLPRTKRDTRYHGFGTRSMRHIAEKYGAELFFWQEGDRFVTSLMLPDAG